MTPQPNEYHLGSPPMKSGLEAENFSYTSDTMFIMPRKINWLTLSIVLNLLWPVWVSASLPSTFTKEDLLSENSVFKGDFDEMAKRKFIRVLMPYNRAFFFFEGGNPKGISYESAMYFEAFVNKRLKTKDMAVRVLVIPTPRDKLLSSLAEGFGDIAIGNLTITDERRKIIDFSDPFAENISEILVTEKKHRAVKSLFDLSGMTIRVRRSSSYYESLVNLNEVLRFGGKEPVKIVEIDDRLEDSDLLEMMNVGLIPATIIDQHKGEMWKKVFPNIRLHPDIQLRSGGEIAWALRRNSPRLKAMINEFVKKHKVGTTIANVVINRYLKSDQHIKNPTLEKEAKRFRQTVKYFKIYGEKYNFDYLMLAALAFRESRLNQSMRSEKGAVGVMQILPSTAEDKNVNVANIEKLEPNIHAGTKYLRFMADRYFPDDGQLDTFNRVFFTFASYNAGPARVAKLREEAEEMGLDPNVWFNNVEVVAAKRIGRETVQYVSSILKYYVAYKLLAHKIHQPAK